MPLYPNGNFPKQVCQPVPFIENLASTSHILDIGCAAGSFITPLSHTCLSATGIDLDPALIKQAESQKSLIFSRKDGYFPLAIPRMCGLIPLPPAQENQLSKPSFPANLTFIHGDILKADLRGKKYDIITCLSVSKWIHLVQGDQGIVSLFRKVFQLLAPGGSFVLHVQPWSSYTQAFKQGAQLKEKYGQLKLRPEQFEHILLNQIGFESVKKVEDEHRDLRAFSKSNSHKRAISTLDDDTEFVFEPEEKKQKSG